MDANRLKRRDFGTLPVPKESCATAPLLTDQDSRSIGGETPPVRPSDFEKKRMFLSVFPRVERWLPPSLFFVFLGTFLAIYAEWRGRDRLSSA
jgi:hypothetical protein